MILVTYLMPRANKSQTEIHLHNALQKTKFLSLVSCGEIL